MKNCNIKVSKLYSNYIIKVYDNFYYSLPMAKAAFKKSIWKSALQLQSNRIKIILQKYMTIPITHFLWIKRPIRKVYEKSALRLQSNRIIIIL